MRTREFGSILVPLNHCPSHHVTDRRDCQPLLQLLLLLNKVCARAVVGNFIAVITFTWPSPSSVDWPLEQKIRSKAKKKYNTKSAANSKFKCAPVLCIHVSLFCNKQLAHCQATTKGSAMQSGGLATRTEY
jgi:hypothetical protein